MIRLFVRSHAAVMTVSTITMVYAEMMLRCTYRWLPGDLRGTIPLFMMIILSDYTYLMKQSMHRPRLVVSLVSPPSCLI